jgi:hypothetical protein
MHTYLRLLLSKIPTQGRSDCFVSVSHADPLGNLLKAAKSFAKNSLSVYVCT